MIRELTSLLVLTANLVASKKDPLLYCDVCKAVMGELRQEISYMPENQKVRIVKSQSRLNSDGSLNEVAKMVPIYQSLDWLEDTIEEKICQNVANDYVKWFDPKDRSQWRIGRIMTYSGQMNTEIDMGYLQQAQGEAREVNEKSPNDRSRNIRWYCETVIEEIEDTLYAYFKTDKGWKSKPTEDICKEEMGWCDDSNGHELFEWSGFKKDNKDEL